MKFASSMLLAVVSTSLLSATPTCSSCQEDSSVEVKAAAPAPKAAVAPVAPKAEAPAVKTVPAPQVKEGQ